MDQAQRLSDAQRRRLTGLMGSFDTDPEAPGPTAMETAQFFFPYGKVAQAAMAAPRAAAATVGGMGLLAGSGAANQAEAQSRRGAAPKVDPADAAAAEALPEHLRAQYLDLAGRNRMGGLNRADRDALGKMNGIISGAATGRNEEERTLRADQMTKAEEARMRAMGEAPKTFAERFPDWNSVQGFVPFGVGLASTLPIAGRAAYGANQAAKQWRGAVDDGLAATNPVELAKANALAQAHAKRMPNGGVGSTLKPYAAPMAIGAIEGAGVSNAPEAYNIFLPPENPERKAMAEYLKNLPPDHPAYAQAKRVHDGLPETMPARDAAVKHFTGGGVVPRMLTGAGEGAAGAALATTIAKPFAPSSYGYPRAGTDALQQRVMGGGLDDATNAIHAESRAMGTVLPKPPERAQLPQPPSQGLLGPPQPMRPPATPDPIPMPTSRLQAELMVNAGLLPASVLERFR